MMHIPTAIDLPLRTETDGTIRIGSTRVTLDVVIELFHTGLTAAEIASELDSLNPADVYVVIGYYLAHRAELDAYLTKREARADDIRSKVEALPDHKARMDAVIQARLEAKRHQGQ
jgi:uncharacterized protein (DUF433 family)